jgi:hypothetical protein
VQVLGGNIEMRSCPRPSCRSWDVSRHCRWASWRFRCSAVPAGVLLSKVRGLSLLTALMPQLHGLKGTVVSSRILPSCPSPRLIGNFSSPSRLQEVCPPDAFPDPARCLRRGDLDRHRTGLPDSDCPAIRLRPSKASVERRPHSYIPRRGSRWRSSSAKRGPNLMHHSRSVSWLT